MFGNLLISLFNNLLICYCFSTDAKYQTSKLSSNARVGFLCISKTLVIGPKPNLAANARQSEPLSTGSNNLLNFIRIRASSFEKSETCCCCKKFTKTLQFIQVQTTRSPLVAGITASALTGQMPSFLFASANFTNSGGEPLGISRRHMAGTFCVSHAITCKILSNCDHIL